jgi:hypothetical protein
MASSSSQAAANSEAAVKGKALVKAAGAGNINEVTRLLSKKADINYLHKWIVNGNEGIEGAQTPLMAAVIGGHAEVVKFLITRKANVNLADPCNEWTTPLYCAAWKGNVPLLELLISKGAKHDLRDRLGGTPLHLAAFQGHKEAVACLLDHGADINAASTQGNTPLNMAANKGHLETVKLLVLKGADMKMKQSSGLTALDNAALNGHDKVVDFLINAGARFDEGGTVAKNCNACGKEDPGNTLRCIGCLAIHYCCEECQRSDWKNHKAQCRNIKAMKDKYKDSKIKEEIEERLQKLEMEEQAKNEGAGPSTSSGHP